MLSKWSEILLGRECESRERLFRVILLTGSIVAVLALLETLLITDDDSVIIPLLIMLATIAICTILLVQYRKLEISAVFFWFSMNVFLFPCMFFLSGGIDSGAMVWFVLVTLYVFIMFSGRKLLVIVLLSCLADTVTFWLAYQYPEYVKKVESIEGVYFDALFSIIVVGVAIGCIIRLQIQMFEKEREINQAQKEELTKISKYKDSFFANMSHEIRTPINTVIGLNEMILRETHSDTIQDYAYNIQMASKMLLNLVNDILELSQLEMKQMRLVPVEYSTKAMFREVVDMIRVRAREKNLEFQINIDENLPSVVFGDEKRIKQVLLNILTNAVKYTQEGSVTLSVDADIENGDSIRMKMSVADTGMGIHKENLPHLFSTYSRLDQRKNMNIEGSGLGLAITKQLVDLMDGEISVDSIYMKGSVFTVVIEQRVVNSTPVGNVDFQGNKSHNERYHYHQSFEAPEARVLIVDDSVVNAKVAGQLLSATKVQVDIANSGMECLKMTRMKYYDVILMDHMMPEMNGIETLIELRKQENGLCRESPVLALTANTLTNIGNWYIDNGFNGYLEKPIEPMKLESEILRFLPDEIVEYRYEEHAEASSEEDNIIKKISSHKKKKIYITSDCVCDLPEYFLKKYDIKLMYYYIKTKEGRFADTREIDSDNLSQYYIMNEVNEVKADSVSVEEYEEFFAEALTEADQVVHIVMAANAGRSQSIAHQAAKGFDHVKIIDSGQISVGEGLIVLYAAKLVQEGYSAAEICKVIDKMKGKIVSRYFIPDTKFFYKNGYTNRATHKLFETLQLHPLMKMKHSRLVINGFERGKLEESWIRFIKRELWKKWRINTDIIFITHVGCTEKQLEKIQEEISKMISFKQVIVQKTAFSIACNSGVHSVGFAYYMKSNETK